MDRKKFLSALGISLTAVCAGGCLASCSKGSTDGGGSGNPPSGGVNFTVDLNNELKSIGATVTKSGVIVVRLSQANDPASFTAVQVACTHQGTAIEFSNNQGNFVCPNHGSRFSTDGTVLNGPATASLKKYKITVAGTTMTVSE